MLIKTTKIPAGGASIRFTKAGDWLHAKIPEENRQDFRVKEIHVDCRAVKTLKNVVVEGTITADMEFECCRCLKRFDDVERLRFKYVLVPAESTEDGHETEAEKELTADDLDFGVYRDETIDLSDLVAEQIILNVPVKPLCMESCRGICPRCGVNLNEKECTCERTDETSPFAVLKDFQVKKKRG
ncbi:MAG: DUF177 domain-containing protein [Deltaproteobacteria bacterium]|nr:DUF177 domain-containing protein [Deltaproteobacteria bacterium]